MSGTVYLLHFDAGIPRRRLGRPDDVVGHYLGWTDELARRIERHRRGDGARLVAVAAERGIGFTVARVWAGDRNLERRLKRRHEAPRLCPLCRRRRP